MPSSPYAVVSIYLAAFLSMLGAVQLRQEPFARQHDPLARGAQRGELTPGIPRLDPDDALANAALLRVALNAVGTPGLDESECHATARRFSVLLSGRQSNVRFSARAVCQLRKLKQISAAQPGFGRRGLGEVAAFVLGRRLGEGREVDVTRIIVPPFRFTGDTVNLLDADLGPLLPNERFIGTYHTHPEGDLEQGILSETDLRYIRYGYVDFHGQVGSLHGASAQLDWLFDIVEPRDGDWNVYAHDRALLERLRETCETEGTCPLDDLRLTGSRFYLFTRTFEERTEDTL
jgi:hypothetical protein